MSERKKTLYATSQATRAKAAKIGGCANPGGSIKQLSERGRKEEGGGVKTAYDNKSGSNGRPNKQFLIALSTWSVLDAKGL